MHEINSQPKEREVTCTGLEEERPVSGYGEPIRDRFHLESPVDTMRAMLVDLPRYRGAPTEQAIIIAAIVANDQ